MSHRRRDTDHRTAVDHRMALDRRKVADRAARRICHRGRDREAVGGGVVDSDSFLHVRMWQQWV